MRSIIVERIETWVMKEDAFFSPSTWFQFIQHIRTTNSHEGWHNRLKSAADRKSKLNFYKLIELIHYESSLVPLQWALLCQDKLRQHSTQQAGTSNQKLFELWNLYNNHDINLIQPHVSVVEVIGSCLFVKIVSIGENSLSCLLKSSWIIMRISIPRNYRWINVGE